MRSSTGRFLVTRPSTYISPSIFIGSKIDGIDIEAIKTFATSPLEKALVSPVFKLVATILKV